MFEVWFLICMGLVWIVSAVVQDLRTREVSNWLGLSLIVFALGFRFFWSLFSSSGDWAFFYQGLIGLGIFFVLGIGFYYSRVFAGGDAKLMIALGTVLPFHLFFYDNLNLFFTFIFLFLISGSVYGLLASIYFAFRNKKEFNRKFKILFRKKIKTVLVFLALGVLFLVGSFYLSVFFVIGVFLIVLPYLYLWTLSVDRACMVRKVSPKKLTEGDWLYKDVHVGKGVVKASWDGLSKEEISLLRKNRKNVFVRYGIPFTPVFLIAFIVVVVLEFFF